MKYSNDIEQIKNDIFKKRFENELHYLKVNALSDDDENWMTERITHLEKILENLGNQKITVQDKNIFTEIDSVLYKRPWNKLQPIHRMKKIQEYLDEKIENDSNRTELIDCITKLIYSNKMSTKKSVDYDHVTEKILNIHSLEYDETKKRWINIIEV